MFPIHDIQGIEQLEKELEGNHVIILLLVKPQDTNADEIIKNFNYLHVLSGKYCSIYPVGYSEGFCDRYPDAVEVKGVNNSTWEYSDSCFVKVRNQLRQRLKNWNYSHEPEILILKNTSANEHGTTLDFRGYVRIDINRGIKNEYIRSYSNFMGNLVDACRTEVEPQQAVIRAKAQTISCRHILEVALSRDWTKKQVIRKILSDAAFFKSYRNCA